MTILVVLRQNQILFLEFTLKHESSKSKPEDCILPRVCRLTIRGGGKWGVLIRVSHFLLDAMNWHNSLSARVLAIPALDELKSP